MLHSESKEYDACFHIVIERKSRMTIEINTNFLRDLREITEKYMIDEWGWDETEVKNIKDEDFFCYYFSAQMKFPSQTPREIMYPPSFSIPENCTVGWDFLKKKVESGESLYPHLSRQSTRPGWVDGMSNEWGISHFHLGTNPNPKNQLLIQGTRELLLAMFTDEKFYIIGFYDHKHWTDASTLEVIHKNWPCVLEKFRVANFSNEAEITEEQRHALRKKGANSFTKMGDGSLYSFPGGGSMSNKVSALARIQADSLEQLLVSLKDKLEGSKQGILDRISPTKRDGLVYLDAKLTYNSNKPEVIICDHDIKLTVGSPFLAIFPPGIIALDDLEDRHKAPPTAPATTL